MADAFQTESRRKPTRLQQVGRFLEGFGAGSQGKGREYIADLRTERELRNKKLAVTHLCLMHKQLSELCLVETRKKL